MESVKYEDHIRRFVARRLHSQQDVEDVIQDVHLRLLHFDASAVHEPAAYVVRVASHALADFLSRRDEFVPLPDDYAELVPAPPEDLEARHAIERCLRRVNPTQAAALVLHDQYGVPMDEVAVLLRLAPSSVDKYLARGRRRMRKLLTTR